MRHFLRIRHLVIAAVSTGLLALVVARPDLAGRRVADAVHGLGAAEPVWLWVAGVAFAATHLIGALAWRSALGACGTQVGRRDAAARYGVGSGLNAVAPAHLGSAVRVALFARVVEGEGGLWRVGGVAAAVGAVRAVWLASVISVATALGAVPAWPLGCLVAAGVVAGSVAVGSQRVRNGGRMSHVLDAFRELGRRPRSLLAIVTLTGAGMAVKLAAAAAVAAALGIDQPLLAAVVLVPAVELAAVLPLTPGNVGVASAAVAVAVATTGVDAPTALGAGIAFGAVETLAAVAVGAAGALALAGPPMRPAVRVAAAATATLVVATAYGVTVLLPVL